jgi:hypothetical protein
MSRLVMWMYLLFSMVRSVIEDEKMRYEKRVRYFVMSEKNEILRNEMKHFLNNGSHVRMI